MTTAPSFSPANPEPKIYLALSHDDFISISPAIFRRDMPICHLSPAGFLRAIPPALGFIGVSHLHANRA